MSFWVKKEIVLCNNNTKIVYKYSDLSYQNQMKIFWKTKMHSYIDSSCLLHSINVWHSFHNILACETFKEGSFWQTFVRLILECPLDVHSIHHIFISKWECRKRSKYLYKLLMFFRPGAVDLLNICFEKFEMP